MRAGVFGLVAAAAVALAAGSGGSGVAAQRTGLFEVGADGIGSRLLLPEPGLLLDLSPSRDQALIVRHRPGGFDLEGVDLASGHERLLVGTADWILTGSWSPSGKAIAFDANTSSCAGGVGCATNVWLIGSDGRTRRLLARRARQPSWAPDSRRVVYVGGFDPSSKRGVVTIAGREGHAIRRVGRRGKIGLPRWSPDGRWIAYLGAPAEEDSGAVTLIRPDGYGLRRFGVGSELAWSRGGRYVAFVRRTSDGRARLDVLDRRTGRVRRLAAGWDLGSPAWRPDGNAIAYVRYTASACGSETELDVVPLRGGSIHEVTALPQCVQVPRIFWSRDGRSLFYVSY